MSALLAILTIQDVAPSELPTEEWVKLIKFAAYVGAQAVTSLGAVHGVPKLSDQGSLRALVNDVTGVASDAMSDTQPQQITASSC